MRQVRRGGGLPAAARGRGRRGPAPHSAAGSGRTLPSSVRHACGRGRRALRLAAESGTTSPSRVTIRQVRSATPTATPAATVRRSGKAGTAPADTWSAFRETVAGAGPAMVAANPIAAANPYPHWQAPGAPPANPREARRGQRRRQAPPRGNQAPSGPAPGNAGPPATRAGPTRFPPGWRASPHGDPEHDRQADDRGHARGGRQPRRRQVRDRAAEPRHDTIPKPRTKMIGKRLASAIMPKPSVTGLRPRMPVDSPTPSAVTRGTVRVDVVTPPAS